MLFANFNRKEHLQYRAASLRQHGFLVASHGLQMIWCQQSAFIIGALVSTLKYIFHSKFWCSASIYLYRYIWYLKTAILRPWEVLEKSLNFVPSVCYEPCVDTDDVWAFTRWEMFCDTYNWNHSSMMPHSSLSRSSLWLMLSNVVQLTDSWRLSTVSS